MAKTRRKAPLAVTTALVLLFPSVGRAQRAAVSGAPYPGGISAQPSAGPGQLGTPVYGYPTNPWPVAILRSNSQRARLQVKTLLRWQDVCVAPCSAPVDPRGLYRIGGGVIQPSDPFTLPRPSGQILIDARATTIIKHWVGFGLMLGGAIAAAGGVTLYASAPNAMPGDDVAQSDRDGRQAGGLLFGIAGVVLMAVGIPMFLRGTSVEIE